jgi:hypothetical protein
MRLRALCMGLGLVAAVATSPARAHAPLARAVAVAPDGSGALVVRMPGFGFLVRSARDASFAYACDALYGVSPLEESTPLAYRADGTLLVGTPSGLRVVERDGCPTDVRLPGVAVLALAVHDGGRIYAITQAIDAPPVVQRSDDGGERWQSLAALDMVLVTALVLDASNADRLFVSQSTAAGAVLTTSQDGGATLQRVETAEPWILLHAQPSPPRLWARARIADQPVGVRIAHAPTVDGEWQPALEVNFFGGFALDGDVIFAGDEARGVFRSDDGGESFEETQPEVASASLAFGGGALWTCTPGLPDEPALMRSSDARAAFEPVMAFDDVDQLVGCDAALEVERVCAAAWAEWRRDVLLERFAPEPGMSDAAAQTDGGVTRDAGPTQPPHARGPACTLARAHDRAGGCMLVLFALLLAVRRRRSTRARRDSTQV